MRIRKTRYWVMLCVGVVTLVIAGVVKFGGAPNVAFDDFMEVRWPMVLISVFAMLVIVMFLFALVFHQLNRAQLKIERSISNLHAEAKREREGLAGRMDLRTEELKTGMVEQTDSVVEQVDERQHERFGEIIRDGHE